jgi:hypothetical protein
MRMKPAPGKKPSELGQALCLQAREPGTHSVAGVLMAPTPLASSTLGYLDTKVDYLCSESS